jgi:hypothetical protein
VTEETTYPHTKPDQPPLPNLLTPIWLQWNQSPDTASSRPGPSWLRLVGMVVWNREFDPTFTKENQMQADDALFRGFSISSARNNLETLSSVQKRI